MIDARTPVVIVTGFLGSGKTTLVNRLVAREKESLVLVNEFGEVPVDHLLIESSVEKTTALPNGCVCCRVRTDLEEALVGAAMRRRRGDIAGFDRVIVETSGIADPGPVAQTLFAEETLARDYRLGKVISVVDTADAGGRRAAPEIAAAQIAAADLVVLSKPDRSDPVRMLAAREEVRSLNPLVPCIEAAHGEVDAAALLDPKSVSDADLSRFSATAAHPADIGSFVLEFPRPVERRLLEKFLNVLIELRGADLLRVKGGVRLAGGELVVVQGVRHVFDRLRPARQEMPSALVFIAKGLKKADAQLLWNAIESVGQR